MNLFSFDDQIKQYICEWIEKKSLNNNGGACEFCGHKHWSIANSLIFYDTNAMKPMVVITCKNCANIKTFNATLMKLPGLDPKTNTFDL